MNVEVAVDVMRQLILMSILCVGPFLIVTIIIGVCVSLFQTITSIQDQTIAFVPKLLGTIAALWILVHWLLRHLIEFSTVILERMGEIAK